MIDQINTLDPRSLNGLKLAARDNSPEAVKAAAKQFEAMFLQIVLKTMREAAPTDSMMDSDATRFYQGLYDQQLAGVMAQRGGVGLAAALERQMLGIANPVPPSYDIKPGVQTPGALPQSGAATEAVAQSAQQPAASTVPSPSNDQRSFVEKLWPQAQEAARQLGVPPHFLVAQAALETGWGKGEIRAANGQASYNLFNIKATKDWTGPTVDTVTTEYVNGVAQTSVERFRAYGSYAESFQDFVRLMQSSPRYAKVAGNTDASSFARALQSGGYATDPAYADKLTRVINGSTLRQSLIASSRA